MELLTEQLTDKEKIVLSMLGKGDTNKGIAQVYDVDESTVCAWLRRICDKLNARTILQAALIAYDAGIIE